MLKLLARFQIAVAYIELLNLLVYLENLLPGFTNLEPQITLPPDQCWERGDIICCGELVKLDIYLKLGKGGLQL
jgi:hypothetical protein